MRGLLSALLILVYISVGGFLYLRASRYLKDPSGPFFGYQIWQARYYTDAGQAPRLAAVRFYLLGAIGLIVALWLLSR